MDRRRILECLAERLQSREEIIAAYMHGSFLRQEFRDVDIAVLTGAGGIGNNTRMELGIEQDIRIAPESE